MSPVSEIAKNNIDVENLFAMKFGSVYTNEDLSNTTSGFDFCLN